MRGRRSRKCQELTGGLRSLAKDDYTMAGAVAETGAAIRPAPRQPLAKTTLNSFRRQVTVIALVNLATLQDGYTDTG